MYTFVKHYRLAPPPRHMKELEAEQQRRRSIRGGASEVELQRKWSCRNTIKHTFVCVLQHLAARISEANPIVFYNLVSISTLS